jgi:hypothetical protein
MATVPQAPVGKSVVRTPRLRPEAWGDRGSAGETVRGGNVGKTGQVIANLAEHAGTKDRPESGEAW